MCLSASACQHYCTDPDVAWGSMREIMLAFRQPPSCALLGGFAIGARVALLWQHSTNAKFQRVLVLGLCLVFVYQMHWIDPQISFFPSVGLCVCEQIGCRTITSTVLYRFSRNFACGSEIWSLRRLSFVRQTGSSLPILEVCGFGFSQFSGSGDHIFNRSAPNRTHK